MHIRVKFIVFLTIISSTAYGQISEQTIEGKVTFITSKNVYVKFDSTKNVRVGDSLKIENNNKYCLLVTNKSTSSVVCEIINECDISKETKVFYTFKVEAKKPKIIEPKRQVEVEKKVEVVEEIVEKESENKFSYKETISARLSVASYSNLSNIRDNRHRVMTRLSVDAAHINASKFSFDTYLNYTKNIVSGDSNSDLSYSNFKVYDLALRYDIDTTFSVVVGRKINSKASTIGAIDGLQAEKYFGKAYVGAIVGFRPDMFDYGFNSDLFQYGGYLGIATFNKNFHSQTTGGFVEQTNNSQIDRRYAFFQHSSTIFKNFNLFSSIELDLYSKVNGVESSDIRLTNLYVSGRYRFSRKINLMMSFDSRKRILYYETLQSDIERLLDDDIARQGLRARLNVRPFKYVNFGASYSKRFQNDTQNKSDNIYGNVSYSKIPAIGGSLSLNYNMNSSNYLKSNIASLRYSKSLLDQRLNVDGYYRFVQYDYTNSIPKFSQNYFGAYASYYINRSFVISLSGEYSAFDTENNTRINFRIIKRFYRQRKK